MASTKRSRPQRQKPRILSKYQPPSALCVGSNVIELPSFNMTSSVYTTRRGGLSCVQSVVCGEVCSLVFTPPGESLFCQPTPFPSISIAFYNVMSWSDYSDGRPIEFYPLPDAFIFDVKMMIESSNWN